MMEGRYHATTQIRFYPVMSNVNKNITVEAKLISPNTYICYTVDLLNSSTFLPEAELVVRYNLHFLQYWFNSC